MFPFFYFFFLCSHAPPTVFSIFFHRATFILTQVYSPTELKLSTIHSHIGRFITQIESTRSSLFITKCYYFLNSYLNVRTFFNFWQASLTIQKHLRISVSHFSFSLRTLLQTFICFGVRLY